MINGQDAAFGQLQVWTDDNADGVSQEAELHTLDSLGITQLDLAAEKNLSQDNGNIIGLTSSYQTSDGSSHQMADVWFIADKVSGMVDAMSGYQATASGTSPTTSPLAGTQTDASASVAVAGMVASLGQYDANGNVLATGTASVTTSPAQTNTPEQKDLLAVLTTGKS